MLKILLLLSNSIVIHPLWIIYSNIVLCSPNLQEQCFPSPSTSLPIELADREMHFSLSLSTLFFIYHFSQLCCGKEISTSLLMSLCFFLLGKKISTEDSKYLSNSLKNLKHWTEIHINLNITLKSCRVCFHILHAWCLYVLNSECFSDKSQWFHVYGISTSHIHFR